MNTRYESGEDAIPHETTVLVLSEIDTCFGDAFEELFEDVRTAIDCDKQIVQEHHRNVEGLPDFETLIQYDIWVVHNSVLLIDQDTPSAATDPGTDRSFQFSTTSGGAFGTRSLVSVWPMQTSSSAPSWPSFRSRFRFS